MCSFFVLPAESLVLFQGAQLQPTRKSEPKAETSPYKASPARTVKAAKKQVRLVYPVCIFHPQWLCQGASKPYPEGKGSPAKSKPKVSSAKARTGKKELLSMPKGLTQSKGSTKKFAKKKIADTKRVSHFFTSSSCRIFT